jgi:N-acetylmuramoyl-L-alanine amidase
MKAKVLVILLIVLVLPILVIGQTPTGYNVKRVIIDAGHGGKDPGAIGTGRHTDTEADVALAVSLQVRDYILQYYDSVEVIMTRDSDNFVELRERTKIANEAKADLFISIHCNTNGNTSASGAETYVIGMHKTKSNMEVAKRENQVIYLEEDYEENYAGFDPNSPESMIALTMMQSQYLDQSILFANKVQQQFQNRVGRKNRGVKQAGYWVISYTLMPSVLIELGFISNHGEEDFLNSDKGQVYMASAIYRAFKEYKTELEGIDVSKPKTIEPPQKEEVKKEIPINDNVNPKVDPNSLELNPEIKSINADIDYRVQVALSTKKLELKSYNFKGYSNISMIEKNGKYRYFLGHFSNFDDALTFQRELREEAFKDAFLVVFYKGSEIKLKEAEYIINQNK